MLRPKLNVPLGQDIEYNIHPLNKRKGLLKCTGDIHLINTTMTAPVLPDNTLHFSLKICISTQKKDY